MDQMEIKGATRFSVARAEGDEPGCVITIKGEYESRLSANDLRAKVDDDAKRLADRLKEHLPHVTLSRLAQHLVQHVTIDSVTRSVL